jgi:hypothetical protein
MADERVRLSAIGERVDGESSRGSEDREPAIAAARDRKAADTGRERTKYCVLAKRQGRWIEILVTAEKMTVVKMAQAEIQNSANDDLSIIQYDEDAKTRDKNAIAIFRKAPSDDRQDYLAFEAITGQAERAEAHGQAEPAPLMPDLATRHLPRTGDGGIGPPLLGRRILTEANCGALSAAAAGIALVLVIANPMLEKTNRAAQAEITSRQQFLAESTALGHIHEGLLKAMATAALQGDTKLRDALAEAGITIKPGAAAEPPPDVGSGGSYDGKK